MKRFLLVTILFALSGCGVTERDTIDADKVDDIVTEEVLGNGISSVEDLLSLIDSNDEFVLLNDIDLSGSNFKPIVGFKGTLDGNGYTISNMNLDDVSYSNVGFFSVLEGNVTNLIIIDAKIKISGVRENIGIIAGKSYGHISHSEVNGTIDAPMSKSVGGIVGLVVSNEYGIISGTTNSKQVFGNTSRVDIVAYENVAGIIGLFSTDTDAEITDNKNYGSIQSAGDYTGGIIGRYVKQRTSASYDLLLRNNSNFGRVSSEGDFVGGIAGKIGGQYIRAYLTGLVNENNISGKNFVGGICGSGDQVSLMELSSNKGDISGSSYIGGYAGAASGTLRGLINNNEITGSHFVGGIVGEGGTIEQSENHVSINATGFNENGTYVGGIAGVNYGSLLNNINTADISGPSNYVGGISGYVSTDSNLEVGDNYNTGNVTGKLSVGGILGKYYMHNRFAYRDLIMTNNTNSGDITGIGSIGGIVGSFNGKYLDAKLAGVINSGTLNGEWSVGGIFGSSEATINVELADPGEYGIHGN